MRVVIADDQLLIREGLTKVLAGCGIDVPASAGTVSGLMDAIDAHHPDAAIVDIRMPPEFASEGLRAAEQLQVTHPELAVLILSQYAEPAYAAALLADSPGRRGYLLKERVFRADQLVGTLYQITAGQTVVDPAVIDAAMHTATTSNRLSGLSARELEVLHLPRCSHRGGTFPRRPARGPGLTGFRPGDANAGNQGPRHSRQDCPCPCFMLVL